jgi:signal transduction histidine kinase
VRRIIDEHGGSVDAANREGGGATMTVVLPVAETARTA